MLWQNICDAVQSIRTNALRSLLTTLSIVIGVAALIAMLSIGAGAQSRIAEQIRSLGANVVMMDRGCRELEDAGIEGHVLYRSRLSALTAANLSELLLLRSKPEQAREHLRDAFVVVRTMQSAVAQGRGTLL